MSEILEEVSKLSTEERHLLFDRLNELEEASFKETPEMLAAIDEAIASPRENDLSVEQVRQNLEQWLRSK